MIETQKEQCPTRSKEATDPIMFVSAWLATMQDAAVAHRNALHSILVTFGGAEASQITDVDDMAEAWSKATATMAAWAERMEGNGWLEAIKAVQARKVHFDGLRDAIAAMRADLGDADSLPASVGRVFELAQVGGQ